MMERKPDRRSSWFLLTGVMLGILLGVGYAWYYAPVVYRDTAPAYLRDADKDHYRSIIALAYAANGDRGRADARLKTLGDRDGVDALASQAQRYLGGAGPADEARALAELAAVLGKAAFIPSATPGAQTPPTLAFTEKAALSPTAAGEKSTQAPTQAVATQAATFTPFPTFIPTPSQMPSSMPGAPFAIVGQSSICNTKLSEGLMQVIIEDAGGSPVPGVRIVVTWDGGEDFFFTGLAPEINLGYADFTMQPGTAYSVRAGEGGQPVNPVSAQICDRPDGSKYLGGVKLRFRQ